MVGRPCSSAGRDPSARCSISFTHATLARAELYHRLQHPPLLAYWLVCRGSLDFNPQNWHPRPRCDIIPRVEVVSIDPLDRRVVIPVLVLFVRVVIFVAWFLLVVIAMATVMTRSVHPLLKGVNCFFQDGVSVPSEGKAAAHWWWLVAKFVFLSVPCTTPTTPLAIAHT